jgi:ABC-type cobalamin/Fe3+-siderophores transport system ATPase subunit
MWPFKRSGGDSDKAEKPSEVSFAISRLEFNDGTKLDLAPDELLVLVGPNNVGKTATLVEVLRLLRREGGTVLRGLKTVRSGGVDEVRTWLDTHCKLDSLGYRYEGWGASVSRRQIEELWKETDALGDLAPFLCRYVTTEDRLAASRPVDSIDALTQPCQKPIQALAVNKNVESHLSEATLEAFGIPLFLDRWSGQKIGIRCGAMPDGEQWTLEFLRDVRKRTPLQSQGDGIRSFAGCILEGVLTPHPVVLLDEPEAFLHPQHARVLGRMLASAKPKSRQLLIATHSVHLLLGLLDAEPGFIRVIRITRDGDTNRVRVLHQAQIKEVWQDPLLRASNVLEGVFHEQVVICEGDTDCRFYSCVLDAVLEEGSIKRRPDVMFISCGGKSRMPMVIRALRALDVPVRAVLDFDVLEEARDLRAIVEACGGNWADLHQAWQVVNHALRSVAPPLSLAQVQSSVAQLLQEAKGAYLDEPTRSKMLDCLRSASPWAAAKRAGKSSLPSGGPTDAFNNLSSRLMAIGIFVVECGELERFVPSVGGHGPAWLTEVLRRHLAKVPELEAARAFVRELTGISSVREAGNAASG